MSCLHAVSSLLETDRSQRIGSSTWQSFVDNPFFREVDFVALERKQVEPIFVPSSEKTNFDATYDLEELLLEEAPLEARTRKQKPRAGLKADASATERRADELHKMIETLFIPFDYTSVPEERHVYVRHLVLQILTVTRNPVIAGETALEATAANAGINTEHSRAGSPTSEGGTPLVLSSQQTGGQHGDYFTGQAQRPSNFSTPRGGGFHAMSDDSLRIGPGVQANVNGTKGPQMTRTPTVSGTGVQVVFNKPIDGKTAAASSSIQASLTEDSKKPHGMLGFLNRKKGRAASPKPKERGVLGKEGARVIVSS